MTASDPASAIALGGVFLATEDVARLVAWYRALGVPLGDEGHAFLPPGAAPPEAAVFAVMEAKADLPAQPRDVDEEPYGRRRVTVNLRVGDLDATVRGLRERGAKVAGPKDYGYGRFAWATDPDGNVVEVWQPATPP